MTIHQDIVNVHATGVSTRPDLTHFARSVRALQDRSKAIPAAWRPMFNHAVRRLQGMDCEQRADLRVSGPWVSDGSITFSLSRADRCVEGVVRRTAAQLQERCELCGRPGRMRVLGIKSRVLCADCYAPRALERDVNRLLADDPVRSDLQSVLFEADLSARIRAFAQAGAWREYRDAQGNAFQYLLREDLRGWPARLSHAIARSGGTTF